MVTYRQVVDAKPGRFLKASRGFETLAGDLDPVPDVVSTKATDLDDAWSGCGAASAGYAVRKRRDDLADAVDDMRTIGEVLYVLYSGVRLAQEEIAAVEEDAAKVDAEVSDDGEVSAMAAANFGLNLLPEAKATPAKIEALQRRVDDAVDRAAEADEDASERLKGLAPPLASSIKTAFDGGVEVMGLADTLLNTTGRKSRWLGPAGQAVTIGSAGLEQVMKDRNDPELSNWQKASRATYASVVTGGAAIGGSYLGAQAGASAGAVIGVGATAVAGPHVGAVTTAVAVPVLEHVGGGIGGELGGKVGDYITDNTIEKLPFISDRS